MPLPIAHALVGASVVAATYTRPRSPRYLLALIVGASLANAADLDFLLVIAFHSRAWHRGFTHSLVFAACVTLLFVFAFGHWRRARDGAAYGLAFASHCILDFLTTKEGGGVELLWPFSTDRFALSWAGLSELPSRLPPLTVLKWLAVEFALFAPLLLFIWYWRRSST
ncbi:MAG TPA: metal-dependent hydrolase [Pyrinomonadaceae bacterium]|nr:metal-dependent hydrolase [Pyrinomonadaceae bacterium]